MVNFTQLKDLSKAFNMPIEDVLFVILNINGVNFPCDYNRMRMGFRLADDDLFAYARQRGVQDYYFALAINEQSEFTIVDNQLMFDGVTIGKVIDPSEDFCDSNYPRRKGTVLNMNPNARTSCRGCKFCYTAYQVPRDRKKIICEADIRNFLNDWLLRHRLPDLSHLIQVAVVTGCYNTEEDALAFLLTLRKVLNDYSFYGEIFYLGSQITSEESLKRLQRIQPFGLCLSLECFERRDDLLRDKKRAVSLQKAYEIMSIAKLCGFRVNFSYVLGLEPLEVVERYFAEMKACITSFPIVNTIQLHKYHSRKLLDAGAHELQYFMRARKIIEHIFIDTAFRPRVWENYRSLWFLTFGDEVLEGIRTP